MKKIFFYPLLICAVAIPVVTMPLFSSSNENLTYAESEVNISIIGEAESELTPDRATISMTIENIDKDIATAKDKTFSSFENVVNILVENGIARDTIIVENYTSYPNYDYSCGRTIVGYYSTMNLNYTVDELSKIKTTIDAVTDSVAVNIQNINYQVSNEQEIYNDTLAQALSSAREKAEKILNKEEVVLTGFEEECVYYSSTLYRCYNSSMDTQDMVGKVKIKARVKAQFC